MDIFLIPARSDHPQSQIDGHFGRSKWYLVADGEGNIIESLPGNTQTHHKGIFNWKSSLGFTKILTSNMGPGAYTAAADLGIGIYMVPEGLPIPEAIQQYKKGDLTRLTSPAGLSCGHCHS